MRPERPFGLIAVVASAGVILVACGGGAAPVASSAAAKPSSAAPAASAAASTKPAASVSARPTGSAAASAAPASGAAGANTIKLISFSRSLGFLAANAKGFLEKEKLNVVYEQTPSSAVQMRGLLDGKWDLAHTAPDNVMAFVDKEKADAVAVFVGELGLNQKLIVKPDITSYGQLRGQTLAVDAIDTGFAFALRKMLQKNGLNEADYKFEAVGGTTQRYAALKDGKVVGGLLSEPFESMAVRDGFRLLQAASDYFPTYPGSTSVAVTRKWATSHRDQLVGYQRALLAGLDWGADPAHREEAIDIIAADQKVPRDQAMRLYENERKSVSLNHPNESQIMATLQTVLDLRREFAPNTGSQASPTAYYDGGFARAAEGK